MCPPHLYLNRHGNVISRVVPASSDLTQPKAALRGDITYHLNCLTTAKMAKTHKRSFGLSNRVHHMLYWTYKHPVRAFFLLAEHNICYVLLQRSSIALAMQRSWFWFSGKTWNDKTYTLNAVQGFFFNCKLYRRWHKPFSRPPCHIHLDAVCCYSPELNYILEWESGSTSKAFKLLWIKSVKCMKILKHLHKHIYDV